MSHFVNCDEPGIASAYDKMRSPMGADVVAGLLREHSGKPLKELHVLDAGCGTGQYAESLIKSGVGRITLLDTSKIMLDAAKENLRDAIQENKVDAFVEASLPDLPFEDGTFDGILLSHVLNHLEDDWNGVDFPGLEKMLTQTKRVLCKNGILLIITSLPSLIRESIWFAQIHPAITEKMSKVYPSGKQIMNLFAKHGFNCLSAMNLVPTATSFYNKYYLNPEGPLDEDWRNGVCIFQSAGTEVEKELVQMVLDMKEKGTLTQFVIDHDRSSEIGIITLYSCISV